MKVFRVGMLIPWVNTAMEEEIPHSVHPNIVLHWSRMRPKVLPKDGHDTGYLGDMVLAVPGALECFDGLELEAIVLGCTSVTLDRLLTNVKMPKAYGELAFITAFDSIVLQIRKLKAKTLLLFAPYSSAMMNRESKMLTETCGVSVVKCIPLTYADQIKNITVEQVCRTFEREYVSKCDAVLFSCTALYTLEAICRIKAQLDVRVPILSSNSAISDTLNDSYYTYCAGGTR
jgi:maleate cis-trans isomerase